MVHNSNFSFQGPKSYFTEETLVKSERMFDTASTRNHKPLLMTVTWLQVAQILETTFLTMVNYASLVATNAARHRRVAGKDKMLLEFGLRRAQARVFAVFEVHSIFLDCDFQNTILFKSCPSD